MTSVTLSTTPILILNACPDRDRTYFLVPSALIYICVDGTCDISGPSALTATTGIPVAANTVFTLASSLDNRLARRSVWAVAAAATPTVAIQTE